MKNLFFPVMLFAVALSSCAKDEPDLGDNTAIDPSDLVSVNVSAGTTKGEDTTTTTLETSKVIELHIDDSGTMNDTYTFTYSSGDWSQTDTSPVKWSEVIFPANFYSLHDGTAFGDLTFTDDVATYRAYSVSGESSSHKDLVYHASKLTSIPAGGAVSALHKHALSKINICASTGTNIVYIARVILYNIDGTGTVTITPLADDAASTAVGASWVNDKTTYEDYQYYYIGSESPSGLSGSSQSITTDTKAPLMIIPQTTTAITSTEIEAGTLDNAYIEVIYYMTDASGNPLVGFSAVSERTDYSDYSFADQNTTLYVMGAFPLGETFSVNQEYDITLGLGADNTTGGILLVDYYVDKDGGEVILTKESDDTKGGIEIPDIDEGDDILDNVSAYIDILVSSDTWGSGGTITSK